MIEALERRTHLNGTLRVFTDGEAIRIVGDRASTQLSLRAPEDGDGGPLPGLYLRTNAARLIVDGRNVIGQALLSETDGRSIEIDLGEGQDDLSLGGGAILGGAHINMGSGDDTLISSARYDRLTVEGGEGEDRIGVGGNPLFSPPLIATGNVSILPGPGRDRVFFGERGNKRIEGKLLIVDRQGPLSVTGANLSVRRETTINTGNSIDRITLTNARFGRNVYIDTRGNDDVIDLRRSVFRRERYVWPGEGDDNVIE
ncbi:MAG TPA: hypothetical protein VF595_12480 [Tepidisphaeraceae bacterium]|jgi:hypothetical protein